MAKTTEVAAPIDGWQTYTDSAYHFKTAIPPGWRIGTTSVTDYLHGGECSYDAMYFPPGDTRPIEPKLWVGSARYMLIEVGLNCPQSEPPSAPWFPEGHVTISGADAVLYKNDSGSDVSRTAFAQFGAHPYYFTLVVEGEPQTAASEDVSLYMGVLDGFVYQGSK